MRIIFTEEVTKVVQPSKLNVVMTEDEGHRLIEELESMCLGIRRTKCPTAANLLKLLQNQIGQR